MNSLKTTKEELVTLHNIHELLTTYQEIAAMKMQQTRNSVLQKRDFFEDIQKIYQEVTVSYKKEILHLMKKKKITDISKLSLLQKNGKTARVFLAANTGLYGDIIRKTLDRFLQDLDQNSDIIVIGNLGKTLFEETRPTTPYQFFAFPDQEVDLEELQKCILYLLPYEKIYLYHGKFQSVMTQLPDAFPLTGAQEIKAEETTDSTSRYFFEPSLEHILSFFEKEVFSVLFEQAMNESALAKFASRMVALENAGENVKKTMGRKKQDEQILSHNLLNKKQINSLSYRFFQR